MRRSGAIITSVAVVGVWIGLPALVRADGGRTVSLESLMEAGRRNHPTLAKRPLLAHSLELSRERINRAYWPQLSLGGRATWQSDVTSVDIPLPGATIPTPSKDQYRVTLDLQQNLWDGGVAADQKRVAQSRSRIEQEKVNLDWYQVRDRILQLYFAGLVQQELRDQARALDGYLDTVVEKAQLALKHGVATERDVLLAKARQLEARQATADATAKLASVRRSLEDLTGARLSADAMFATPVAACSAPADPHPRPDAVHRPELGLLAAQGALLDAQEKLDRAADHPRVGAFATAGYGRPGLNALSDKLDFYFIGGVQVTVPLTYLYAGTHRNGREQLAVQRSLLTRQQEAVMTQINVQLDTQRAELGRLDGAIVLDDQLLQLRERARKQTELQLSLGTATMTDLVNDLSREDQARTRRTVHRAQRSLACHQLHFIMGDL